MIARKIITMIISSVLLTSVSKMKLLSQQEISVDILVVVQKIMTSNIEYMALGSGIRKEK